MDSSQATSSSLHSFSPSGKHAVFYNLYVGTHDNIWKVSEIAREQLSLVDPQRHQLYIFSIGVVKDPWTMSIDDLQIVKEGVFVHLPDGQESSTLQELWSYCSSNSTLSSEVVVYLHSKGSYHDKPAQAGWRQYLQAGALSEECRLMPNSCDTCGSRMSPLPFPHFPGNMWAARCDYISRLIQPKLFESAMDLVFEESDSGSDDRCPPAGGEADNCYGIGRFSSEHWVLSHPDARPCDLDSNPKYAWGKPSRAGLEAMRSFLQKGDEVKLLQPAPRSHMSDYRTHHDCPTCGEDVSTRIDGYRILYKKKPPASWWGWKFFKKEPPASWWGRRFFGSLLWCQRISEIGCKKGQSNESMLAKLRWSA